MSNDIIILNQILHQKRTEISPTLSESDFFEIYSVEQVLKNHDLSYDELESGIVGSGQDGGVDGFYIFINGEIINEKSDLSHLKKNINIELVLIQAKTTDGFKETPVERLITVSDDILDLTKKTTEFKGIYNSGLIESIELFRDVQNQLAAKFPAFKITYYYVCKGDAVSAAINRKKDKLETVVKGYFQSAEFSFHFIGARQLLALSRRMPSSKLTLPLAETPVSSGTEIGYICLAFLKEYYNFIKDDDGNLKRYIFEANVRDYQGGTQVNKEIQESLSHSGKEDFWWLNNGVTIIAENATVNGKSLIIENPQVVNGLQTSSEIFEHFKRNDTDDARKLLVKVVAPKSNESVDRIIKASNSQTQVQAASLRATDKIHRDIEEYFKPRGLFYDRRKNFYKNQGKPRNKVISIPHLAQSVMSIVLMKPNDARARPSSLLKKDADYLSIFNDKFPIEVYYTCADLQIKVEEYLKSSDLKIESSHRNNIRFYVSSYLSALIHGSYFLNGTVVSRIDLTKITEDNLKQATEFVLGEYKKLGGNDKVSKGPTLISKLKASFASQPRTKPAAKTKAQTKPKLATKKPTE